MTQHARPAPRRVAIYARYSTDMQNPMSVEDQFRLAERYAAREGWVVVERSSDRAISGTASHDRADFLRLMDALVAKNRTFDVVLAESLDRVSRDAEHLARFSKLAIHARVEIHTVDRGKSDALAVSLSSLVSSMFLERLSANVHRGIEGNVSRGMSGGGRIFGYKPGPDQQGFQAKGKLVIDEIAAAVGQHGAVQIKPRSRKDLAFPIEWQVVGILADQHMRDAGLGRQAAHDQMRWCWGLVNAIGAGPARIFGAHGDDDSQLCRHNVQPLAAVFADPVHDTAATSALVIGSETIAA